MPPDISYIGVSISLLCSVSVLLIGLVKKKIKWSLIILLLLTACLFLISSVGLTTENPGRDAKRESDFRVLENDLESYFIAHDRYPDRLADVLGSRLGIGFISALPKDPLTGREYEYAPSGDRKSYVLRAVLEDPHNFPFSDFSDLRTNIGIVNGVNCNSPAVCFEFPLPKP